jgi:hypothetical protein
MIVVRYSVEKGEISSEKNSSSGRVKWHRPGEASEVVGYGCVLGKLCSNATTINYP